MTDYDKLTVKSSPRQTAALRHRSDYDDRYYRDRINATRAMLEIESGEPASRLVASVWLDRAQRGGF